MRGSAKQLICALAGIAVLSLCSAQPFSPRDEAFRRAAERWTPIIPSGGTNVTLAWNPPYPGDLVTITNYNIYYGVQSGTYTNVTPVGTVTNATITLPATNTTYFFAATDVDTNGMESIYSVEISYMVP